MKLLGFMASAFKTEKKNAAGKKIAAEGIKIFTIHFHPFERLASSTYRQQEIE
jgi:hypothetical protein